MGRVQLKDYTSLELASLLRVHVTTVRRWIIRGDLQAIRLPGGGVYRITPEEVARIRQPIQIGER